MALESTWCPVLQNQITCVTDSAGWVAAVLCPELDRSHHTCRMKREAFQYGAFLTLFSASAVDAFVDVVSRCRMGCARDRSRRFLF
jgi:hypothetical protein